ncbi:hypothetical protein ACVBEQ_23375 [Nakamurella sp. GG22]
MKTSRIVALVIGCLLLVPGLGMLFGGGLLGLAYTTGRNDAGYFSSSVIGLRTATAAITAETPTLTTDLQKSTWVIDTLDTDVRLRATAVSGDVGTFLGIGPAADVDAYLSGVGHAEIIGLTKGTPVYRTSEGGWKAAAPGDQTFWVASTQGVGTQELSWHPTDGRWAAVIMNADGSPGVSVAGMVQIKAGFLLPLLIILLIAGFVTTAGAIVLIVVGASGRRTGKTDRGWAPVVGGAVPADAAGSATAEHPVVLTAHLDPGLSRWKWMVKWFLAIPHYVILTFLWPAFLVVTVIAGSASCSPAATPAGCSTSPAVC